MEHIIKQTIEKLNLPSVQFADVRITKTDNESIYFQNGFLRHYGSDMDSFAIGIRVLIKGCWGFAGSRNVTPTNIDKLIKTAITNAEKGSLFITNPVNFKALQATVASNHHVPEINPFSMDQDEKMNLLSRLANKIKPQDKIVHSMLMAQFMRQEKIYVNTEGTFSHTSHYNTLPMMMVVAADGGQIQSRTWPGHMSGARGGFELFEKQKFEQNTDHIIKEATDLLTAPMITDERADLIIGNGHLALQLHESVGHATEADRIFGMEISYAGKTFIKPSMLGNFQYGSDLVTIYSDSSNPRGMGYHPVDDEGVPGKRVDIIKNGILKDQQTSRHIAQMLDLEPSSNMKASYGDDMPLVRMTNFCLAPVKGSLADLIAETEHGYLVDFTKTWSIDDNRNNFQFTTEIGYKIEAGITKDFWNSCDRICGPEEWELHGTFHCGKGEPGQAMQLSHGVAPARFKNINVKVSY